MVENAILAGEKQRLAYVAATRARHLLVVCYRTANDDTDANRNNPWRALVPHLAGASRLDPDASRMPPERPVQHHQASGTTKPSESSEASWKACLTPTARLEPVPQSNSRDSLPQWAEMWQSFR